MCLEWECSLQAAEATVALEGWGQTWLVGDPSLRVLGTPDTGSKAQIHSTSLLWPVTLSRRSPWPCTDSLPCALCAAARRATACRPFCKAHELRMVSVFYYFFKDFIPLFDREGRTEREHKQAGCGREKQASRWLSREPDAGTDPGTPG